MSAKLLFFAGLRGLTPLRMILGNSSSVVILEQLAIPHVRATFDKHGNLTDENQRKILSTIVSRLIDVTGKLQWQ